MQKATLTVMSDGERWLNYDNGDARRVGEQENLIPYSQAQPLLQMLNAMFQGQGNGQQPNIFPTAIGQHSDSNQTGMQQQSDNDSTRAARREQTENARNLKPAPEDSAAIVASNAQIVKLLRNDMFVRDITGGTYRSFKDLPHNCPQRLVDEINAMGIRRKGNKMHTTDTVSRVVSAMKIEDRPTKGKVLFLVSIAIVLSVGITRFITPSNQATSNQKENTVMATNQNNKKQIDFDRTFDWWKQKTKRNLTDTRIAILKKMIDDGKIKTNQELINEIQNQYQIMIRITKNK